MDAEDEREFAEFVLQDKNVVFIPQVSDTTPLLEFRYPAEANHLKHGTALRIWNKAICERLTLKQYAPNVFAADIGNNDPLIGFERSFFRVPILVAGQLSAEMYSLDAVRKQLVYKGKEFEQWYNKLARWIRRHYEREKLGMYIGPSAHQAYERGEIRLADHMMTHGPINVR